MSDTGNSDIFDAVRSALEENIVSDFAQSGYHHISKAGLGARVEALVREGGTVWSTQGLSILDEGLNQVSYQLLITSNILTIARETETPSSTS